MKNNIPFSPPRIDKKIIDEVVDTLQSGWITTGPKTKRFENEITSYCGHRKTLCVSSGSAGLELMLRWFGVKEGDEVILPAYTYAASANCVVHCGAKVVFVDVSSSDFNISLEKIEAAITPRTKVIMPVDIGGWPCNYDAINSLVKENNIKNIFQAETKEQEKLGRILVISDAAHSLGSEINGKKSGSFTDITVFSFHAVKNLTTAEGGAVCLNLPNSFDTEHEYKQLNLKSLHGQNKDALAKTQIGNWRYDIVEAGYKYNMTDIQAAMGLVELHRYESDMLIRRKTIFDLYSKLLKPYAWANRPIYETPTIKSSFHVYLLRINNISEEQRDQIMQKIFDAGVSVNVHFIPLPMMTFYKKMGYSIDNFPVAYSNYSCEISLPVYYNLTDAQVERVVNTLVAAVETVLS